MLTPTREKIFLAFLGLAIPLCQAAYAEEKTPPPLERLASAALEAAAQGKSLLPIESGENVSVSFVKPGSDPWRFGILQKLRVKTPLARLLKVIDDTKAYVGLFQIGRAHV